MYTDGYCSHSASYLRLKYIISAALQGSCRDARKSVSECSLHIFWMTVVVLNGDWTLKLCKQDALFPHLVGFPPNPGCPRRAKCAAGAWCLASSASIASKSAPIWPRHTSARYLQHLSSPLFQYSQIEMPQQVHQRCSVVSNINSHT